MCVCVPVYVLVWVCVGGTSADVGVGVWLGVLFGARRNENLMFPDQGCNIVTCYSPINIAKRYTRISYEKRHCFPRL